MKLLIVFGLLMASPLAFAAGDVSLVTFNLAPGAQSTSTGETVVGFRGTGLYGENKSVFGFDVAILVNNTKETFGGLALAGLANITGKEAYVIGLQLAGLVNINRGKANVYGLQIAGLVNTIADAGVVYGAQFAALANFAPKTDIYGFQVGLLNRAQRVVGFQIGLLNFAETLHGIQIGLLNFSSHGTLLPVFPVLNIGF